MPKSALLSILSTGQNSKNDQLSLDPSTPVQIEQRMITGLSADNNSQITVYKGIPYAAAPVGALRWEAPQPAKSWEGVKTMEKLGNQSLQQSRWDKEPMSEDCLFLNIWTPAKKK